MKGGCLDTGYTAHMLKILNRPRLVHMSARESKVIGGPNYVTQEILSKVLRRMQNWCTLACHAVRAEFPGFEALQSFMIFCLHTASDASRLDAADTQQRQDHFERLAALLGIECQTLQKQYKDYYPRALRIYNSRNIGTMAAWREALSAALQGPRRARQQEAHPCDVLLAVLARFGAYGGTTSGVERTFALKLSTELDDDYVNDVCTLALDRELRYDEEDPTLLQHITRYMHDICCYSIISII